MNVETAGHPLAIIHDKCPVLKPSNACGIPPTWSIPL